MVNNNAKKGWNRGIFKKRNHRGEINMDTSKTAVVLLVEDDPADQKLVKNALVNQKINYAIYVAENGEEALEYLQRSKCSDPESPRPNLILLDLNMPGMGGKAFLRHIKTDDDLCSIPVVVLTVSDLKTDIQESYKLQAAGYIQKSASPKEFQEVMDKLTKYWFEISLVAKNRFSI
jgi:CheY-like chemotaxis protein